jgi:diguanylate cyclase
VHRVLGDDVPYAMREFASRTHSAEIGFSPGDTYDVLVRVQTTSSVVLPISFRKPKAFSDRESSVQMAQGLAAGLALCLVFYSLAQAVALRDSMFAYYAASVFGTALFSFVYFGLAPQYLWPHSQWLTQNTPPLVILLAICGSCLFLDRALLVREVSPRMSWALRALAATALATGVVFALGLVDYRIAHLLANVLGPAAILLGVPAAWTLARRGDMAARFVLIGWCVYGVHVFVMAGLLRGFLPTNMWTLHAFQIGSLFEAVMWMLALGARMKSLRSHAEQVNRERDALQGMANTDALTGLLNRRGLQHALEPALAHACAVYVLDLDGFKTVNDSLGHDAGDALLAAVARRLKSQVRATDLVARWGGDEFVVVACALNGDTEAEARRVGNKLLATLSEAFDVGNARHTVGVTIGYVLAPHDGQDSATLLKLADAAMYAGKQAGKQRMLRGATYLPGLVGVAAV